MTRKSKKPIGPDSLEIIEEATHLLRTAPWSVIACYYIGSLPFVLGLFYFWADMSRSVEAAERVAEFSFLLAALFCWMKTWHAVFCEMLTSRLSGEAAEAWTLKRITQVAASQTTLHALGFPGLAVSAAATLPLGFTFALFQNIAVIGAKSNAGALEIFKKSWKLAAVNQKQNHIACAILSLFGFVVFINMAAALLAAPKLLNSLLGWETAFSMGGWSPTNTTFLTISFGLSVLIVDPIIKSFYTLRCFYGESYETGADLLAELKNLPVKKHAAATVLILFTLLTAPLIFSTGAGAQADGAQKTPTTIQSFSTAELNDAITKVLKRDEFSWRLPRDVPEDSAEKGVVAAFLEDALELLADAVKEIFKWIEKVLDWIFSKFPEPKNSNSTAFKRLYDAATSVWGLLFLLLAIVSCSLVLLWKRSKCLKKTANASLPESIAFEAPDLNDEDVGADQMEANEWLSLGRKLLEGGDARLGLRALYLGCLAHLSRTGAVTLARHKSNRDYSSEVVLRTRGTPNLPEAFAENVRILESVWYGNHSIDKEKLTTFAGNQKRILSFGR